MPQDLYIRLVWSHVVLHLKKIFLFLFLFSFFFPICMWCVSHFSNQTAKQDPCLLFLFCDHRKERRKVSQTVAKEELIGFDDELGE